MNVKNHKTHDVQGEQLSRVSTMNLKSKLTRPAVRNGLQVTGAVVLPCAFLTLASTSALSDCVTANGTMTCTGTPDGFDGGGNWKIGFPGDPKTVINNGTLAPPNGDTGILFIGGDWSITNNGTMKKSGNVGAVVFAFGQSTDGKSVFNNTSTGSVTSSDSVGAIVAGYSGSTNNLQIKNGGTIYQSTTSNLVSNPGAIYLGANSLKVSIDNLASGSIIGGDGSAGVHHAISNAGQVSSIVNSGLIKSNGPSSSAIYSYGVTAKIGTIRNSGTIQAVGSVSPKAIYLFNTSVQQLMNFQSSKIEATGSSGADAIYLKDSQISALANGGQITSTGNGIVLESTSSIMTLQNIGSIVGSGSNRYGIRNEGTIGTLINGQSNLTYYGVLPTNYLVSISSPSSYGQLAVTSPSGTTNFGIYSTSNLSPSTTYTNVITGITAANFENGIVPTGRFGTGAMVTQIPWYLQNTGENWDLVTQPTPVQSTDPVVTGSSSGTSLAQAISKAGAKAVNAKTGPTPPDPGPTPVDPTLANGTSLSGAVQSLTETQVNSLFNAHAEGYSSNMTILMERMAGISNATMDRIKNLDGSKNDGVISDRAPAKYLWGEVTGYRGSVDSYDNLAGFNYDVYDFMVGTDFYRTESAALGVFGGGGTSRMTESAQVDQSYDSANFYGGLYGAAFFPQRVKLSGSAGYMYSHTDAQRDVPDIGDFTGGSAHDSYSSNGIFGALKLSRPIELGSTAVLTPFIAQSYSQLWVGNVDETGGGDLNFSIDSATSYSTVSFIGIDAAIPLTDSEKDPLTLIAVARYGYDWFANDDSAHEVTANSPIFGDFVQVGANMGANSLQLGAGLQGGLSDNVTLRAGVMGDINSHGNEIGAGARLRVEF